MHIDVEMAIAALHSVREMHVLQMNGLRKFLRIVMRDHVVIQIEQVAFAIVFEDGAKNPAVSVIIGELRVLQLRIQFGDAFEKILDRPKVRAPRPLPDCSALRSTSSSSVGLCCSFGYMNSPSVSWSHQV